MPAKASLATTRDNILQAATKVFARYGYDGGSVEKISKSAKSVDRMIYYYFGSKEGLFIEVLEDAFLRRLVVVGHDRQRAVGADLQRIARQLDGLARGVPAGAGHDGHAPLRMLDGDADDFAVLVDRDGG